MSQLTPEAKKILTESNAARMRMESALRELYKFSKILPLTLKDAGRIETAKELERLLYMVETEDTEFDSQVRHWMSENQEALKEAMFGPRED